MQESSNLKGIGLAIQPLHYPARTPSHPPFLKLVHRAEQLLVIFPFLFCLRAQVQWDKTIDGDPWQLAASWVTHRKVVKENDPEIGAILQEMHSAPIEKADVGYRGTQLKMLLHLQGNQRVSFKPKWFVFPHVTSFCINRKIELELATSQLDAYILRGTTK